ncbi:MAG: hypothetical protein CMF50_05475 [Legionellales bacterium]|nr:hypothetical protein [Legionellales bacterium]|tara:strand:- start:11582 stop:12286 length:705 start_codon:yes stop_codon:yes gene_type:complete
MYPKDPAKNSLEEMMARLSSSGKFKLDSEGAIVKDPATSSDEETAPSESIETSRTSSPEGSTHDSPQLSATGSYDLGDLTFELEMGDPPAASDNRDIKCRERSPKSDPHPYPTPTGYTNKIFSPPVDNGTARSIGLPQGRTSFSGSVTPEDKRPTRGQPVSWDHRNGDSNSHAVQATKAIHSEKAIELAGKAARAAKETELGQMAKRNKKEAFSEEQFPDDSSMFAFDDLSFRR